MAVVDAGYETLTREALLARIDELSASLGYRSGEFLHAVQAGLVPDTPEASSVLALVSLIRET